MADRIYIANETFRGGDYLNVFVKDVTRVREGHPILTQFPHMFHLAECHYEWPDVEAATSAPGEKRGPGRPRKVMA